MTSIVVLTYNQLEDCTKSCIESIYKYTKEEDFELIVVDNNSQDGTQKYLKEIEPKYENMRLILNETNKGYSGGNNDGIKVAQGEYVILLNNDTLVSENWLEQILKPFEDKKVGMVGPVSNSVGNEQRIKIEGLNDKNYNEKIKSYIEENQDVITVTQRLGFFCVAIKAKIIQDIGLLDEQFGIGMFEDDDYCMRATQNGYKLVITDGCFIYHKGSVSFKKLTTEAYQEIFQKNKAYFLEKHGAQWSFSDILFAYWKKFNYDINDFTKNQKKSSIDRIAVRFDNFKHLIYQAREIELKNLNITKSLPVSGITKTKWQMRWINIKEQLILGDLQTKLKYFQMVYQKLTGSYNREIAVEEANQIPEEHLSQELKELKELAQSKRIIIFPPTIDYTYMKQRPQHLADEFSKKGYLVIYTTLNHKSDKVNYYNQINDNLILLNEGLLVHLQHIFKKEDVIYYCLWPNNKKYIENISFSYLIYDYMDELELLDLNQDEIINCHNYLVENANLITVSATKLYNSLPIKYKKKILLLKNAVDDSFITEIKKDCKIPNEMSLLKQNYKKIVGYYGAIAPWIDFDLIEYGLQKFPNFVFVLIGPIFGVEDKIISLKNKYDNIFVIKEMERIELVPYLNSFDICIIPFIKNNITDSVSPVKVYEYIAANKPVISTNILECNKIDIIDVVQDKEEFIMKLDNCKLINTSKVKDFIKRNRWITRVEDIINFMHKDKSE